MSAQSPLPVILCGKTEQIGQGVIAGLEPEYESIHFIMTPAEGSSVIPLLLSGSSVPIPSTSSLGTKNYSKVATAIILGGGYDDAAVAEMRKAVEQVGSAKAVPWLRPDTTKPAPPLGPEYGKAMVRRVKETLDELEKEGKLEGNGEVVWY